MHKAHFQSQKSAPNILLIHRPSTPTTSPAAVAAGAFTTTAPPALRCDIESHDFETDSLGAKRYVICGIRLINLCSSVSWKLPYSLPLPRCHRIYKKTSPNALVTLYLGTRDIVSRRGVIDPLRGVLFVDPKYVLGHRLFCQLTLTFRYGREDEEVMGLKFCNEAVIALNQIWPRTEETAPDLSPLQEALLERLGVGAHAFSVEVGIEAPPSVQLIPAKLYSGAPIGTSYDIRAFIADQADEKVQRRSTVKLGIRLVHKIPPEVRCLPSQTITSVSSLPKCLRLKLSPKAIKFSNKLCGGKTNGSSRFSAEQVVVEEVETEANNSSSNGAGQVSVRRVIGVADLLKWFTILLAGICRQYRHPRRPMSINRFCGLTARLVCGRPLIRRPTGTRRGL